MGRKEKRTREGKGLACFEILDSFLKRRIQRKRDRGKERGAEGSI
jgi:hypothetical protein